MDTSVVLGTLLIVAIIAVVYIARRSMLTAEAHAGFCQRVTMRMFDSTSTVITEELESRRIAKPWPQMMPKESNQGARPNTDFIGESGAFPGNAFPGTNDEVVAMGGGSPN